MSVSSGEFLLALAVISATFFFLPSPRLRQTTLAACNAVFLYTLVPGAETWLGLAVFLLSGYAVAILLIRKPSAWICGGYLSLMVAAFVVLKKYEVFAYFLPERLFDHPVAIVGLSYMLFRQIHFVVDAMQGQIASPSLWTYLNYQLNLFALLSGPIQRYQEFDTQWNAMRPVLKDRHEVLKAYLRILTGVIKIAVIAVFCLALYERADVVELKTSLKHHLKGPVMFYLYPAYVYFNFSGYCDIVIGGAALVGIRLPENFDRPYLARNMIDYWNRWHQTLSFWIRDYIFTASYKALAQTWPRYAMAWAIPCYFVALFLAGVWHGATMNFVVFGLLNGFGVSMAKAWEMLLVKRNGRKWFREYMRNRKIQAAAIVLNFHFACITFLFFPVGLTRDLQRIADFFAPIVTAGGG